MDTDPKVLPCRRGKAYTGETGFTPMDFPVIVSFVFTILLELVFPLPIAWYIKQRYQLSWSVFGYGAIFFILVQVVHAPLVSFAAAPLAGTLNAVFPDRLISLAVLSIILGLLAGLFEEIGRYLVFSRFFPSRNIPVSRENGLLFGAGWGGVESMLVGILVAFTFLSLLFVLPEASVNITPFDPLIGLLERLMTFPLQVAFTVMVLLSVALGRPVLLGLAILWHTEVDALAVFLVPNYGIAVTEAMVAVNAAIALIYLWFQWPGHQHDQVQGSA